MRLLKDVLSANLNQDGDDDDDDDDDDNYVDDGVVDKDGYYDSYYEDEVDGECKAHSKTILIIRTMVMAMMMMQRST